jgi:hypothetical protein
MQVEAKRLLSPWNTQIDDPFRANTSSFQAQALTEIMLNTFEAELDALVELAAIDRRSAASEALIRRYMTAEEVYKDIEGGFRRIQLKMLMLSDKLSEGQTGRASNDK